MQRDYTETLEREVIRLTRRDHRPLYLFAGIIAIGCIVAWLHHFYPQSPQPFVGELR